MGNKKDNRDDDLTRIENLTEFNHEEDSEIDSIFEALNPKDNKKSNHDDESVIMDLDQLDDDSSNLPPEFPAEVFQEQEQEQEIEETTFAFESEETVFEEGIFTEETLEENLDENLEENQFEMSEEIQDEQTLFEETPFETDLDETPLSDETSNTFYDSQAEEPVSPVISIPEKLTDLKQFASEFSYGKSNIGAGNPPFSIILRNIKYKDDAEDIKILLNEFGIMNENNRSDFETSLNMGALLISQISEFSAIILAHKFRRFDLDLEVGLSDEINPPKTGEKNAKGLIKKETIKQNTRDNYNLKKSEFSISDIIMTTAQNIHDYKITEYIGINSVMTLIDEDDLNKLQYVDKVLRDKSEIYNLPFDENHEDFVDLTSTKDAFLNYQKSFGLIFDELKMRLKQKAYSQGSNGVLGISYQVSPIPNQKNTHNSYSITCSGTFAKIIKE